MFDFLWYLPARNHAACMMDLELVLTGTRHCLVFTKYKHKKGTLMEQLLSIPFSAPGICQHLRGSTTGKQIGQAMPATLATPRPSRPTSPRRPDLVISTDRSKLLLSPLSPTKSSQNTISMGDNAPTSDLLAVSELLSTMKSTLSALGKTFETLGEQTSKVAELGPAMEATHQVSLLYYL